jgi:hypothetical protein
MNAIQTVLCSLCVYPENMKKHLETHQHNRVKDPCELCFHSFYNLKKHQVNCKGNSPTTYESFSDDTTAREADVKMSYQILEDSLKDIPEGEQQEAREVYEE